METGEALDIKGIAINLVPKSLSHAKSISHFLLKTPFQKYRG
jgi:hypothetical protein